MSSAARWYGGTSETTLYIGELMEKVTLGGVTSFRHYIAGGAGVAAVYIRKDTGANDVHYITHDHLGSIDSITASSGAVEVRLSFSAFGQRRNEATWSGNPTTGEPGAGRPPKRAGGIIKITYANTKSALYRIVLHPST